MQASKESIILEGFLEKKSPKAFLGRHMWQDRYFALWPHQLCYYKRKEDVGNEDLCLGFLLVENMSGVATNMAEKSATRFNIVLEGVERQFELKGASDVVARQWVDAVRDVLKLYGKKPISLAPNSPANAAGDRADAKFWKPSIHKKILMQRRQAISAETGAMATDAKTLASRRYEKTPDVTELIYQVIKHNLAFRIMDEAALRQVVSLMWAQEYKKDDVVIAENQPAFMFSVVISGALQAKSTQHHLGPLDIHAEYANGSAEPLSPASPVGGNNFWSTANQSAAANPVAGGGKFNSLQVTPSGFQGGPSAPASPMASAEMLTRGHSYGEVALLYDTMSTHTIRAVQNTLVYTMERLQYKRLIATASEQRFAQRVAFLRTTALLGQLPTQLLNQVAEALEERHFSRGEQIIREGEQGDAFYIIVSGQASAYKDGNEVHVFSRPGEYFGEHALIKNQQRGATITALTDVEVLFLTRSDFVDLMGRVEETFDKSGVRRYSLLNRELAITLVSPTHNADRVGFFHDEETSSGAAVAASPETGAAGDDDVPPPPPPPMESDNRNTAGSSEAAAGSASARVSALPALPALPSVPGTASGTKSVGGIRMHFGEQPAVPEQPEAEAAAVAAPAAAAKPVCQVQSLDDLRIIGTLGRGTFGHVQLVADKQEVTYALKAVNKNHVVRHNQIPHILNERAVMMELNHPFVVRLHRTLRDNNFLYFLLEPSMGGELFSILRARDHFDNATAQFYAAIVVSVFDYMHSKDTLYRDLKPENLLMDRDGYLRVTDFGFAKKTKDRTYTFCGTPDYLAPEIVASAGHHTGADWWTLGILIYEMLAGYTPFYDEAGPTQMYSKILAGKVLFPSSFSPAAQELIASLLQIKPTRRLGVLMGGASLIMRHAWFEGLDWTALYNKTITPPISVDIKDKFDLSHFDAYPEQDNGDEKFSVDPANPEWDHVF